MAMPIARLTVVRVKSNSARIFPAVEEELKDDRDQQERGHHFQAPEELCKGNFAGKNQNQSRAESADNHSEVVEQEEGDDDDDRSQNFCPGIQAVQPRIGMIILTKYRVSVHLPHRKLSKFPDKWLQYCAG